MKIYRYIDRITVTFELSTKNIIYDKVSVGANSGLE